MTPQQIVSLFVRLFAVWLLVEAIQIVGIEFALSNQSLHANELFILSGILLLIAALLWVFPLTVARTILPRVEDQSATSISAKETATVACIVLGLWTIVARALPSITRLFWHALVALHDGSGSWVRTMDQERLLEGSVALVTLIAALFLVFRARDLAAFFLAVRGNAAGASDQS